MSLLSDLLLSKHLLTDGWPLLIATDGGATTESSTDNAYHCASAGAVILQPPSITFATFASANRQEQLDIMNQNLLPWCARATPLSPNIPVLLIMDLEGERFRYQDLRQPENISKSYWKSSGMSNCLPPNSSRWNFLIIGSNLFDLRKHAKEWCYQSNEEQSLWKLDQWNSEHDHAMWAIHSHQLEESFFISPRNQYKQ